MHRKAERGNSIISEEAVCTGRLRGCDTDILSEAAMLTSKSSTESGLTEFLDHSDTVKWPATSSLQLELIDSVINYIANGLLPLSTVENKDFYKIC